MSKREEDKTDTEAQATEKRPPKKPQDALHRPEETLGDAPAGGPNPTERSRLAD